MTDNKYPGDPEQDARDLERTVDEMRAGQKRHPLTTASQGWVLLDMVAPSAPFNGAHIFASGGEPYAASATGIWSLRHRRGAAVSDPASLTASTIGGTPTSTDYNRVVADLAMLRTKLIELITSLENSDQLS